MYIKDWLHSKAILQGENNVDLDLNKHDAFD